MAKADRAGTINVGHLKPGASVRQTLDPATPPSLETNAQCFIHYAEPRKGLNSIERFFNQGELALEDTILL
jgi:hypothetical protein